MAVSGSIPLVNDKDDAVVLRGDRVRLGPLRIENIYKHFEWNNDPELNRLDNELPFRRESFGAFKKRFEQMVYRPSPHNVDFEVHVDDVLIGVAYAVDISTYNHHCSVGVTIGDRDYWGHGYGRESLDLLLEYCFRELGMHRVSTETFEYNEAWRRLVKNAGFTCEGVERDYLFRDGSYWDKEVYGILEEEYAG